MVGSNGKQAYGESFYRSNVITEPSARLLARFLVAQINPKSVVDVGCAIGIFLREFQKLGVDDIVGIDGEWVDRKQIRIPLDRFIPMDVKNPIRLDRKFDLALCLETAEHIEEKYADTLVKSLVGLSNVICFSAAIPLQTGVHHVNLQWQSYWIEKFAGHGFKPIDIRARFWNERRMGLVYTQNMILFVKNGDTSKYPKLKGDLGHVWDMVHPDSYLYFADPRTTPWYVVLKGTYYVLLRAVDRVINKIMNRDEVFAHPNGGFVQLKGISQRTIFGILASYKDGHSKVYPSGRKLPIHRHRRKD